MNTFFLSKNYWSSLQPLNLCSQAFSHIPSVIMMDTDMEDPVVTRVPEVTSELSGFK